MTTATVTKEQEIVLNGIRYPIRGNVQSGLISTDPQKIVTADTSRDTHRNLSVQSWANWTGGVGVDKFDGEDPDRRYRSWDSDCQQRFEGHLVLPGLATVTAAGAAADIGIITEYSNVIYASFGTDLRSYNETTNVWTNVATLPDFATDEVHDCRFNDTVYMAIAYDSGWTYYNGSSFVNDTTDAKFLVRHDERLWGIDSTGQLWWVFEPGETETNDAKIQLGNNSVTSMFVGYDSQGNDIIYVGTTRGLFAHDYGNRRFVETRLRLPFHPDNGKGADSWRTSMFFSAGLGVNKYDIDTSKAQVKQMGPDRDDGLPAARRGTIRQLVPSHNELLAIIDATSIASAGALFQSQVPGDADFADADQGLSHIMGWDEFGWERKWLSDNDTGSITWLHVSDAYNQYRMWWGQNQRVYHMQIPPNIINPVYVTDLPYATSGSHETPDFTGGQSEVDKLAVRLQVEVSGMTSTETVIMSFALNGSSTFTTMSSTYSSSVNASGEITSDGKVTYYFPAEAAPAGTEFRSIRFKATLARGTTTTLTPDILKIDLEWRKKLPALWGHQVVIDMSEPYGGQTLEKMFENIRIATENNALSRFTFRNKSADDAGNSNPWVYYVDVLDLKAVEHTGNVWAGEFLLTLGEV